MYDQIAIIIVSLSIMTSFGPTPVDEVYSYDHPCASGCKYDLEVANRMFSINYSLIGQFDQDPDGLLLERINVNTEKRSVTVDLSTNQYGRIELILPKDLIQSLSHDRNTNATLEVPFTVLIDGREVTYESIGGQPPIVSETNANNQDSPTRTMFIRFENGTRQIEIVGTQVIPEFGSTAALTTMGVMLVSISLMINYYLRRSYY